MSNTEKMRAFKVLQRELSKATTQLNVMAKLGLTDFKFDAITKHREMLEEQLHDLAEELV